MPREVRSKTPSGIAGELMCQFYGSWANDWPSGLREAIASAIAKALRDERRRCARKARSESRKMCRDTDSIQYRVGHAIAKEIEALNDA